MKQKQTTKTTQLPYEPSIRPTNIAALRDEVRASLPDADELESFDTTPDDDAAQPAAPPQTIIIGEDGSRKIIHNGREFDYLEDDDDDDIPEDDGPADYQYDTNGAFIIRSGDEWLAQNHHDLPAEAMLFGPLWMQHELCILFADTNVGKSILAVQIADSLSRGLPIPGMALTAPAAPVLYFDFELSEQQFHARYSSAAHGKYPFTASFHRATLNPFSTKQHRFASYEDFINNEIENALLACKAKTLIIDNITCLRYGTQNAPGALNLMEYLQSIKRRYQVSILVLAHTPKRNTTRPLSRNDLQGSKMLINLADSAFAIGESQQQPGLRYLKQVKQRSISEAHGPENVCLGRITRTENMLHFTFAGHGHENDHLTPHNEQYRRSTEHRIIQLTAKGHSVRQVAAKLGLASTTVFRALKRLEKCAEEPANQASNTQKKCHTEALEVRPEPGSTSEERLLEEYSASQVIHAPSMANDTMTNHQKRCADEQQCADMQVCECADEVGCGDVQMPGAQASNTQKKCHTEALEVRPEPGSRSEERLLEEYSAAQGIEATPMTNDQSTNDQNGFSEPQSSHEPTAYAEHSAAQIPANPPMTNDQMAPCDSLPGEGREGSSELRTLYEPIISEEPIPANIAANPPITNDQNPMTNDAITNDQPPMTNDIFYIPYQHYLTIDEEIDGLTHLAEHEPGQFTRVDEYRLQMLKKRKAGAMG